VVPPIYQSTTYAQPAPGEYERYDYSRAGNPTRTHLEDNISSLEGGAGACSFASGMAAISSLIHLLPAGSHIICGANVYGGTHRVFSQVYEPMGYRFSYVDTRDMVALEAAIQKETQLIFLETPSNPLMHITDIQAVCELASSQDIPVAVDNTFMSPHFQRPLELGANYVIHSGTKYLGGHSDVIIGFVIPRDIQDLERLQFLQKSVGAVPAPFESWLCLRGIKTLSLRMTAHCGSAQKIAEFLMGHPGVRTVHYPGLPSHEGHDIQMKQAHGAGGGMLSFELADAGTARNFTTELKLFTLAESLGAVESLVSVPSLMTHASVPAEHRAKLGIHDGLVRVSVGIEDVEDLLEELDRILHAVT
jgi:cystathionine beta-lyase/cystathionine gamma-synthase